MFCPPQARFNLALGKGLGLTLNDSRKPPCPPFSSLSSSGPSPSMVWVCPWSSSCRLSSKAARVRSWGVTGGSAGAGLGREDARLLALLASAGLAQCREEQFG